MPEIHANAATNISRGTVRTISDRKAAIEARAKFVVFMGSPLGLPSVHVAPTASLAQAV
jgi:hypothetical protein